ncbi:MAG: dCTP deaminase [Candidatus Methanomethylicaceae archaeon]
MCVLSDRDIIHYFERGRINIQPLDGKYRAVQPASVDLRLGDVDLEPVSSEHGLKTWVLEPDGKIVLASTYEIVSIGDDVVGKVEGKSTLARKGLIVHCTAGWIDPGFAGNITLELVNVSKEPLTLRYLEPICQIYFMRTTTPVSNLYSGKYRGSIGIVRAKE